MARIQPLFVTARTAARMLEMTERQFRELVDAGALPRPCRLGREIERWDVEQIAAAVRGDAVVMDEGLEL